MAHPLAVTPFSLGLPLTRAEGLWFEDCGLIIRAEKTIYRVSSAVLAMQSVVFRDMLSMPTPMDAEMIDGCPFVSLPDSAEDITNFLKAIFCYGFFDPAPAPTTFGILCSVLRMSRKYEVDELKKRALAHLSQAHPTTLEDWENVDELPSWKTESSDSDGNIDQNVVTVSVARQVGATWILPTAFYRMCQDSVEESFVMNDALDASDTVNLIKGLRFLETTGVSDVLAFLNIVLLYKSCCTGPSTFERAWGLQKIAAHLRTLAALQLCADGTQVMPFELWSADDWKEMGSYTCKHCISEMKKVHSRRCQKLWEELPEIFGLPSWEELRKMKAEALELE
ncbi:hypothetical protein R3P38DRAFT_3306203 [Favolaschia claudopus]|uniref:BTB domain-containing protein n=1 Tax=Favolaschia claudopus TaxID=2862362 RepID=A0AAW0DM82_9AGAR